MSWEFQYLLMKAPKGQGDGSGDVIHVIGAQGCEDGGEWEDVPSHTNKGVSIPADDIAVVMAMPHSTGPEKQAKNQAYKQLMVDNLSRISAPLTGWTAEILETIMENNQAAVAQAVAVDEYITVTLGKEYPAPFTL